MATSRFCDGEHPEFRCAQSERGGGEHTERAVHLAQVLAPRAPGAPMLASRVQVLNQLRDIA